MTELSPERWTRVQEIFLAVSELPEAEQDQALDRLCSRDEDLREEVVALLRAGDGQDLLDTPLEELALLLDPADRPDVGAADHGTFPSPERAGPYRILEEIGRGGMGVVYRAARDDDQFHRDVALKVVRVGLADTDLAARFRRERQILAALEHPNVARLYDAGVADTGEPYLAMELVRGRPLHRYCDENRLDVPARLRLFEEVCRAVEYAHRQLVIHRDLKPSNILVTDQGEVKLLDFGIARLLTQQGGEEAGPEGPGAPLTRREQRILTPEYASPEQLKGEPLSTASDVFGLGVVLHELLTGRSPIRGPDAGAETSPSTALTRPASIRLGRKSQRKETNPLEAARRRSTTPARLARLLQGELDAIVLKALTAEPERRYPTATALLEDLVRYREGRPVKARPPSFAYRTRKLVRRHRGAVAAAAAFILLLGGSSVLLAVQQSRTELERDRAEAEAAKSNQVTRFLLDMLASSDPGRTRGEEVTVRQALDAAAEQVTELGDQPAVQAEMYLVMAQVYRALGALEEARSLAEDGLRVSETSGGVDATLRARLLNELGSVHQALGNHEAAEDLLRQVLRGREEAGAALPDLSSSYLNLGLLYSEMGRLEEAAPFLVRAVDMDRETTVGDTSTALGYSLNNLAILRYQQGEFARAIELLEESLEIRRRTHGQTHPRTATTVNNLAALKTMMGDYAGAEPIQREALAINRQLYPGDHPDVANALHNLAANLAYQNKLDEADSVLEEALAMNRRVLGAEHAEIVRNLILRGTILRDRGAAAEALATQGTALAMVRRIHGPGSAEEGVLLTDMGSVHLAQDDWLQAEKRFRAALAVLVEAVGPDHPRSWTAQAGIASALTGQERFEEAETLLLGSLEGLRGTFEESDPDIVAVKASLMELYEAWGRPGEAQRYRGGDGAEGGT